MESVKFFRKPDWIACWVTFVVSLTVYTLTLQPTVGLEDSGELIVASDYLGVPHPPGYPIWSLLTWFFQWVLHGVTFHGQPNPAWAVNWFSAVAGAAACGVIALLISRSGRDLLGSLRSESEVLDESTRDLFCAAAGIAGGLLLAFGQGMWSQAVIAEVYSLNIFFQSLVLVFLYRWMSRPAEAKWLMLCAFVFGLGICNHQTLMFMGLAIAAGVVFNDLEIFRAKYLGLVFGAGGALILSLAGVYFGNLFIQVFGLVAAVICCLFIRPPFLVRDFIITGAFYILLIGFNKWAAESPDHAHLMWAAGPDKAGFWIWTVYALAVPAMATFALPNGRIVGPTFLVMFIGLGFYLYMPIASDQNPPINWGYPRTWKGFMHAVTRGQYERVKLAAVFTPQFIGQVETYLADLRSQFLWPIAVMGVIPLALFPILRQPSASRWRIRGRIGRFEYFCWTLAWTLAFTLLLLKALDNTGPILVPCFLLTALILLLPTAKRLQDIGHPSWWALYTLIPTLAYALLKAFIPALSDFSARPALLMLLALASADFVLYLYLLIRAGEAGENGNGANPVAEQPAISTFNGGWLVTTLVAFFSVGIVFMILQNPDTDIQSLFIGRVQYIQSHAVFVFWLGYGILMLMAFLQTLVKNNPVTRMIGVSMVLLLPFVLIHKNYCNKNQIKVVGGAEQNGHDFGWQFGNWQLRGVEGIKEDMRYWYPDEAEFEKQWAAYPNKNYPEPMGPNAIFFGGTDPGRFVPTYMIYSAKVRPDVYLITQNALADDTYMNVMRDLYGDQIWIPSPLDNNLAFRHFYQTEGRKLAGVNTEGGKILVQGVQHVMKINATLSRMIFDHNQYITESKTDEATRSSGAAVVYNDPVIDPETGKPPLRSFYVEESYVLPWMYPYLTPHGLIMKINNQPTPLTDEMVKNDTEFWNWYTERLLNDERFIRDIVARKSFCKLRSALAGLYESRGRMKEAEAAFRQSLALYDLSPEATARLAGLLAGQSRYDEAIELFDILLEKDPKNQKAAYVRDNIARSQALNQKRMELEIKVRNNTISFDEAMELMPIYLQMGHPSRADLLASQLISSDRLEPRQLLILAQHMAEVQRFSVVETALKKYTAVEPHDPNGWINLSALQGVLGKRDEMLDSLRKAVEAGGEPVRNLIRKDVRFDALRNDREFQKIIPPLTRTAPGVLNPLPGL